MVANVERQSRALRDGLVAIDRELGLFAVVRGRGLMLGAVLAPAYAGRAGDILDHAAAENLLMLQAGPDVLSFVPALNITATAGLSLGEFTAHAAAGTFDFATGLNLVFQRGSFMEEACENTKGAMLALLGGEESAIRELAKECDVDVANLNAPGQIVLSGSAEGITDAAAKSKDKGIKRAIPLPVAGAYHSRLMKSAQDKLAVALAAASIQSPKVPVVCNFEARPVSTPEEIRSTLTSQVTGSVRWVESMQHLIAAGHTTFIELGPDATLSGLMGKIDKSVKVISIKDAASLDAAVAQLQ
ncbi:MAG: acyltransferase domain-containing protein [Verrucomicrobia bacterium]|nr:acyltransferase domain-containing protein [Verrucomicrobiota bacterium]